MRNQRILRREAEEIIERLSLFRILKKYGETRVVGSVVLELIVKLDLDLHVLLSTYPLMESVNRITNELLNHENIHEVRISDYRPQGIKIGIDDCPSTSGNWTIDIWLTTDLSTTAFDQAERMFPHLTSEKRDTILALKRHYHKMGKLRDGISRLIYESVLNGVTSVEEFERTREYQERLASAKKGE